LLSKIAEVAPRAEIIRLSDRLFYNNFEMLFGEVLRFLKNRFKFVAFDNKLTKTDIESSLNCPKKNHIQVIHFLENVNLVVVQKGFKRF
jgi:hypothetical protein